MQSIEFSAIPPFLQTSELYKIFQEQDEPTILIDPKYYSVDTDAIDSPEKFTAIMETIRYWGLDKLPGFVYKYILLNNRPLSLYLPFLNAISATFYEQELLFLLKPLDYEGCIAHGFTGFIEYTISNTEELAEIETNRIDPESKAYYPVGPIKNIQAHKLIEEKSQLLTKKAAQYGQLEILKILDENNFRIDHNTMIFSLINFHNHCFEYLAKNHTEKLFNYHITLIGYAISQKNEEAVEIMLQYITPYTFSKVSAEIMLECIVESTFEIFKMLYPFWKKKPSRSRNIKSLLESIAENKRLQFLEYMYQQEGKWIPDTANVLASCEFYDGLHFALETGAHYDRVTCAIAAYKGSLDCVKYLHNKGVELHYIIMSAAAENGNLECIKYLHENGCPWSEDVFVICKTYRYKDCLQYALKHGCPSVHNKNIIVDDDMNIFVNGNQIQKMEILLQDIFV
jgi:hypothetical protein